MKKKYTKSKTRKSNNHNAFDSKNPWNEAELDDLANQIDEISRRRLPDGVMGGILANREAEVRQDAALMLLQGFLGGNLDFMEADEGKDRDATAYHLERVTSIALFHCKNRLKRKLAKEQNRQVEIGERTTGSCLHPADLDFWNLPYPIRIEMRKASLRLGVSTGEISVSSANIINLVINEKMSAQKIADRFGITRGAVYQRFDPVRKVLVNLIAKIEVPML